MTKNPRPSLEPIALRQLVNRHGVKKAAEMIGYSDAAVAEYKSGKQKTPMAAEKAARYELSREDREVKSSLHAVAAIRHEKRELFEAFMKGAGIPYSYLPKDVS